jgi:hypothetical protein
MIKVCSTTGTKNTAGFGGGGRFIFLLIDKSLQRSVLSIFEPRCFWMCKAHRKCETWFVNTVESRLVFTAMTRVQLWPATDSIPTHWRDRQESAWNFSSLLAKGSTSDLEVSILNMGRIIAYFRTFHYCTVPLREQWNGIVQKDTTAVASFNKPFFFVARQPSSHLSSSLSSLWDHTHLDTPHSVGLLWTSDQSDAKTWQHTTLTTDIHVPGGIRTRNPSKQAAANPRFSSRGHGHGMAIFIVHACSTPFSAMTLKQKAY